MRVGWQILAERSLSAREHAEWVELALVVAADDKVSQLLDVDAGTERRRDQRAAGGAGERDTVLRKMWQQMSLQVLRRAKVVDIEPPRGVEAEGELPLWTSTSRRRSFARDPWAFAHLGLAGLHGAVGQQTRLRAHSSRVHDSPQL
eukprot:585333-Prymnesium_polylepis.2